MAKVKFQRRIIEKKIKLDEKIINKINLFGTSVESLTDSEMELEIPVNRPDLMSVHVWIRAFEAFCGKKAGLAKYKINSSKKDVYKIIIDDRVKNVRPYTLCAIVKNLPMDEFELREIINLQEKLHKTICRERKKCSIGIYPLDKIEFPIRLEARVPEKIIFTPLNSQDEMDANMILNKHPAGKLYGSLLENNKKFPIFVDAKNRILSMPPIINSNISGQLSANTNEVFVECSGNDINTIKNALLIIVIALAELGGTIYSTTIIDKNKIEFPKIVPLTTKINLKNVEKITGIKISEKEIERLLNKMGHDYKNGKVKSSVLRTDILHEVDLIEDVIIAYGYENIAPEVPNIGTIGEPIQRFSINNTIIDLLIGLGFLEISTSHLITEEESNLSNMTPISIDNARTNYNVLRQDLLTTSLRTLSENTNSEYPQKICEIGKIFRKIKDEIIEEEHLIIATSPGNSTSIKQIIDYLTRIIGLEYDLKDIEHEHFISGRTASIIIKNKQVGFFGEIHPETLNKWKIKMPVSVAEINMDILHSLLEQNN